MLSNLSDMTETVQRLYFTSRVYWWSRKEEEGEGEGEGEAEVEVRKSSSPSTENTIKIMLYIMYCDAYAVRIQF